MNSMIQPDNLRLALPADHEIYQASNLTKWLDLMAHHSKTNHIFELWPHRFLLPQLNGPIHAFSMYGILCAILLRISRDIDRLVTKSELMPSSQHRHVPWMVCRLDKRASICVPLLIHTIDEYEATLGESNPNCIIIWHCVCMLTCVDSNVIAHAAGRDGPNAITKARQKLVSWAETAAARRACIHAAQSFRILSHRKPADGTAFQSVRTLFMSALVLGFYLLAKETSPIYSQVHENEVFDLSDTHVDWKAIGEEGFSESRKSPSSENAAVQFIQYGGPIFIDGRKYQSGATHAKRVILEFASLLDEVGSHWMADYAQLLYTIHDTIEQ